MNNSAQNGMLTGKCFFFRIYHRHKLADKVIRILRRLEAKVDNFFHNKINIVVTDINDPKPNGKRAVNPTIYKHQAKRIKLAIENNIKSLDTNDNKENVIEDQFLEEAKKLNITIKSLKSIWNWISSYHSLLCEVDEPEICADTDELDKSANLKFLQLPALKVLDPLGNSRPLVVEKCVIRKSMWKEPAAIKCMPLTNAMNIKQTKQNEKNYCYICRKRFSDVNMHLKSQNHTNQISDNTLYSNVDRLIQEGQSIDDFFSKRLLLWKNYNEKKVLREKISKSTLMKSKKTLKIEPVQQQFKFDVDNSNKNENNLNSSSSSSSSSDESSLSSDSFDSSSSTSSNREHQNVTNYDKNDSTKNIIRSHCSSKPCNNQDPPSYSDNDDYEKLQLELTENVDKILNKLSMVAVDQSDSHKSCSSEELPFLNNAVQSEEDCLQSRSPPFKPLLPTKVNVSAILASRFEWCQQCGRNHVALESDCMKVKNNETTQVNNYCSFSPIKQSGASLSSRDVSTPNSEFGNSVKQVSKNCRGRRSRSVNNVCNYDTLCSSPTGSGYGSSSSINRPKRAAAIEASKGIANSAELALRSVSDTIKAFENIRFQNTEFMKTRELLRNLVYPDRKKAVKVVNSKM